MEKRMSIKYNIKNLFILLITIIYIFLFIFCNVFLPTGDFSVTNIIISSLSFFIFIFALKKLRKGLFASNIFLLFFYIGLALNGLELSLLQNKKEAIDIYFFFCGPLVFYIILSFIEKVRIKKVNFYKIKVNGNYFAISIFLIYLLLRIIIFKKTGIKLLDQNFLMQDNDLYSISGLSGLCSTLMLVSLMLMHEGGKIYRIVVTIIIILFECFFMVSRGQIIKIGTFLFMYLLNCNKEIFLYSNIKLKNTIKIKLFFLFFLLTILSILIFVYFGEIRQSIRTCGIYSIINVTKVKIKSTSLAWLYSYYPLNYDVLRMYYLNGISCLGYPSTLLMPVVRLVFNNPQLYKEMMVSTSSINLNGFNAATFLSNYVNDLGYLYFIELSILALYIGFLEKLSIMYRCVGLQTYILMLVTLFVFGDYSMGAYYVLAALIVIFLQVFFIKERKND